MKKQNTVFTIGKSIFDRSYRTDIGELCKILQNNLLHVFWAERYGRELAESEKQTLNLRKMAEKLLSEEEKAEIEAMGGWDKLMETLKKRLEEQKKRHRFLQNGLRRQSEKGCRVVCRKGVHST